jgi:hypothetical protein
VAILKSLSASEGTLVDGSSGLYARFRLGGDKFPPLIYYKVFSAHAVTDVGAFAPRDYSKERQQVGKAGPTPRAPTDRLRTRASARRIGTARAKRTTCAGTGTGAWKTMAGGPSPTRQWRPATPWRRPRARSPLRGTLASSCARCARGSGSVLIVGVRQVDVLMKRKRKKLAWVKAMYAGGQALIAQAAADEGTSAGAGSRQQQPEAQKRELWESLRGLDEKDDAIFSLDWEDQADELLDWVRTRSSCSSRLARKHLGRHTSAPSRRSRIVCVISIN